MSAFKMASDLLKFTGRVALVTGAGGGLGRIYALEFARRGAKVVVNDLGGDMTGGGASSRPADLVVNEIKQLGGEAVANYNSVEDGDKVVETALKAYGRLDIVVNNAGILRDKSFGRMSDSDWDLIQRVHLHGSYKVTRAAWDIMKKQKFGRIIMVSSPSGIYGNFGQANYAAAKLGLVGLSHTLAKEGAKYNITCNAVAPTAASRLLSTVVPEEMINALKAEYIAPVVLYLCHEDTEESGGVFECNAGWVSQTRWQRSAGVQPCIRDKDGNITMTAEMVRDHWDQIKDFSENPAYPTSSNDGDGDRFTRSLEFLRGEGPAVGKEKVRSWTYTDRDVILYNHSIGVATRQSDHLKFLFEGSDDFCALPTFGVLVMFVGADFELNRETTGIDIDPTQILHGEQYLELYKPIPTSACLNTKTEIVDVLDKGTGALIIVNMTSYDEEGEKVFFNQTSTFVVGAGGFGGPRTSTNAVPTARKPSRPADRSSSDKTSLDQAALYRLTGDRNPLHIDPSFAALGGFSKPILHGLCSMGFACRHVLATYAENDVTKFKAMKVRFSKPVIPGETIQTDMWRNGSRIHFESKVVENGNTAITGGYVDLHSVNEQKAKL